MMEAPLPIAIGQFPALVSIGLWWALSEDQGLDVVGVNVDFDELLLLTSGTRSLAAAILDEAVVGTSSFARLRQARPHLKTLALARRSVHSSSATLDAMGVTEHLSFDAVPAEVVAAARRAAAGDVATSVLEPSPRRTIRPLARLTRRELDVFERLAGGRSRAVIALELHIAEGTVHSHAKRLYRKLGVRNRLEILGAELISV